ncbi:unnamed protein product [Linum trigynum]|uniref:Secreted protein n=1 Tax=Linum trigynum TaxID=586398 RepID=A0AAV2F3T9_9ROSI
MMAGSRSWQLAMVLLAAAIAACEGDWRRWRLARATAACEKRIWRLARATGDGALLAATGRKRWRWLMVPLSLCRFVCSTSRSVNWRKKRKGRVLFGWRLPNSTFF